MPNSSNLQKFTKDQLKEELISLGVELPSGNPLKSVYVDLYNLATKNMGKGQFSSDEEVAVVKSSSRRSQRKSVVKPVDEGDSLDDISNNELRTRLKSLGVAIGPIGATTRKVYLNKLKHLLKEESKEQEVYSDESEQVEEEESEQEEEEEEEEEEEIVEVPPVHETRSSTRRRTTNFAGNAPIIHNTRSEGSKIKTKSFAKDTTFSSQSPARGIRNALDLPGSDDRFSSDLTNLCAKMSHLSNKKPLLISDNSWVNVSYSELHQNDFGDELKNDVSDSSVFDNGVGSDDVQTKHSETPERIIGDVAVLKNPSHMNLKSTVFDPKVQSPSIARDRNALYSFYSPGLSRRISAAAKPRRPLHRNVEVTETDAVVKKVVVQTKKDDDTAQVVKEKIVAKPERRWIPVWVQVIITGLIVLFIYLVVQAMESNPDKLFLPKD